MTKPSYEYVKQWRKRTKERLLKGFDNQCGICFYNKCQEALEFHHIEGNKEFNISQWSSNWIALISEVKKCVLLCCRCHREIHAKIIDLPSNIKRFDEQQLNDYDPKAKNPTAFD